MSKPKRRSDWCIKIYPADNPDQGIVQTFKLPDSLWARWFSVSFQFRGTNTSASITALNVTPNTFIYVKERWYHKLLNWIIIKFK